MSADTQDGAAEVWKGWSDEDAEGKRTYTLKWPKTITITVAGQQREERITQVVMRRATGDDLMKMENLTASKAVSAMFAAVGLLTGLDLAVMKKLDTEDIGPLGLAATTLLDGGR
ncbi:MAG: phage tail assembly protein [Pseudomonadota bacterium]